MLTWSLPLAFLLLLLIPSSRVHIFNGLPLSGLAEFVALVLSLPLLVSGALRRVYVRPFASSGRWARYRLWGVVLLGLAFAAKLVLLAVGDTSGFGACYQTGAEMYGRLTACERSYENPFHRRSVTRIDDEIVFRPETWNLSLFNSLRFNSYYWVKGNQEYARFPFAAHWRGVIDQPAGTTITLSYAGEGTLTIEGVAPVTLPNAYRRLATVTVQVPGGPRHFHLDYRFYDGLLVGDGLPRGPYARVNVNVAGVPLRTIGSPLGWRLLGGFVDVILVLMLGSIVWCYARLLERDAGLAGFACVAGALLAIDPTVTMHMPPPLANLVYEGATGLPAGIGLTVVVGTLLVLLMRRPSTRHLLLAYLGIAWASAFRQEFLLRGLHRVFYRPPGDDWMTYESFARTILETGSLEAGEPVFFYQPMFRYILFLGRMLLGDGDTLIALIAQGLLMWGVFWMVARLLPRGQVRGAWRAVGLGIGVLLVALVTSEPVSRLIYVGASESPSWIAFMVMFPGFYAARTPRDWWHGTILLGLTALTRMNHAIALGWLFLVFLVRVASTRLRFVAGALVLLGVIAMLPTIHNLYYGGEFSALPGEHAMERTLPMPPSRWLQAWSDPAAWEQGLAHLGAVTYTSSMAVGGVFVPTEATHRALSLATRGLQLAWLLAIILLLCTPGTMNARLLWVIPALYLAVHLFYQVRDAHPRFIIIGHIAMGAIALLAVRERARTRRASAAVNTSSTLAAA